MIDLEKQSERDKLIDDYFNKGYACDIGEVYKAVVNTVADLEYANDEKTEEIRKLKKDKEKLNGVINQLLTRIGILEMELEERE